jgi:RNA polymerase sigma-70 factor (ECF subfamily)
MELSAQEIARARRGEPSARSLLIRTYQDRVYAVCRALAGQDAFDCAQDTFVKVLTQLDRFDTARSVPLGAFIIRIARNTCIDRARVASTQRRILATHGTELLHEESPDPRTSQIRAAVLELPAEQRSAIALRIWGELDYEQIAEIEGVPIGTIRSRLARARDALATLLLKETA